MGYTHPTDSHTAAQNEAVRPTPGPWRSAPTGEVMRGYHQPFGIAALDNSPTLVAGVFSDVHGGEEVASANARLIAAAPDLLAALKEAVRVVEAPASTVSMPHTMRLVKAAIAKAEGK